jgi:hypothetical protein
LGCAVNEFFAVRGLPGGSMAARIRATYCFFNTKKYEKVCLAILDGYVARL